MGLTKAQLEALNISSFPDNTEELITPEILRNYNSASIANTVNQEAYTVDSASFTALIDALDPSGSAVSVVALNAFTASQLTINSGYNTFTQSANTSISNLSSATSSYVTETESGSFLLTASFNNGTRNLTFTKGNNTTFDVNIPDVSGSAFDTGSLVTTASFNQYTSSTNGRLTNIESTTASLLVETQNLELFSASALVSISNLNASSASQQVSINSLNAATASYVTETESGSFLLTASFDNGTRNLTFTKGNNTQFAVNIPDVSGSTGNFATTGSNTFIGNQTITGSTFISGNQTLVGELTSSRLRVNSSTSLGGTLSVAFDTVMRGDLTVESTSPQIKLRDNGAGGFSSGYDIRVDTGSFEIYDATHNRDVLSDFFDSASASHTTSLTSEIIVISGSTSVTLIGNVSASVISSSIINGLGNPLAFSQSVDSRINAITGSGGSINTGSFITTGSATTASQTIFGDFKFDTTYSGSRAYTSQAGGSNIVYIDYDDAYSNSDFAYWQSINFVGVRVNGTGVTNATVISVGFGATVEVTLSSGTVTNGASYTFAGPLVQTIDITGSLSVQQNVTVNTVNGTSIMDENGFTANNTTFGGTLNPGLIQLRDINNNDIFQFAVSSSALKNGGGQFQGPQIAGYANGADATIIGFQTDTSWTDGRVTILTPLIAQSGSTFIGTNTFSGAVSFTGSAPSILSQSFSGSLITNLTDIYTDVPEVRQIVTLTSASYAALFTSSLTNPNTLYVVSGSEAISSLPAGVLSSSVTNFVNYSASVDSRINGIVTGTGFATTGSNTFRGDQIISASVNIVNPVNGEVDTLKLLPYLSSSTFNGNRDTIITARQSITTNGIDYSPASQSPINIILGSTNSAVSASSIVSGSNNIIVTGRNVQTNAADIESNNSYISVFPSTRIPAYAPVRIANSTVNSAITVVNNTTALSASLAAGFPGFSTFGGAAGTITSTGMFGGATLNPNSSSISIAQSVNVGALTMNGNKQGLQISSSGFNLVNSINTGNTTLIDLASGSYNSGNTAFNRNLFGGVVTATNISASTTLANLQNTIAFGSTLIITGSDGTAVGNGGSAFFGRFNRNDGVTNRTSNVVFAVGAGTAAGASERTPLWVGTDGSVNITGSLLISASTSLQGNTIFIDRNGSNNGNVYLGSNALSSNTTGLGNVAIGQSSLQNNTTANNNFALGTNALQSNVTGNNNFAAGTDSGRFASGSSNVFIGGQSGQFVTGSANTIIGSFQSTAGTQLNNNIILADGVGNVRARYSGSAWNFAGGVNLERGSNKTSDIVTVNEGNLVVNNSLVTADSIILLTVQNDEIAETGIYFATVSNKTAGQFTIQTGYGAFNLKVAYLIINPT